MDVTKINNTTISINGLGDVKPKILLGGNARKAYPRTDHVFYDEFSLGIECLDKNIKTNPFSYDKGRLKSGNQLFSIVNGKLKWDILLEHYRPTRIPFLVDKTKGISLYQQLPLTEQEIKEGCNRPSWAVDSIAIYCDKSGHRIGSTNYKTGKLLHIGRILLIDSVGNTAFGRYELTDYGFDMVFPAEFMRKAKGWILVDPTIGYTSIGGSQTTLYSMRISKNNTTMSENGTANSINVYMKYDASESSAYFGIYNDNTGVPGTIFDGPDSYVVSDASFAWQTHTMAGNFVSGNPYYPTIKNVNSNYPIYKYDTGTGNQSWNSTSAFADNPTVSETTRIISMYIDYTAGGGGGHPKGVLSLPVKGCFGGMI